jgi:hypothetical protein
MIMIDPGEYLMNPIGFNPPIGKQFLESEFRSSKKVLWSGWVWGFHFHANRKRFNNSSGFIIVEEIFSGLRGIARLLDSI